MLEDLSRRMAEGIFLGRETVVWLIELSGCEGF